MSRRGRRRELGLSPVRSQYGHGGESLEQRAEGSVVEKGAELAELAGRLASGFRHGAWAAGAAILLSTFQLPGDARGAGWRPGPQGLRAARPCRGAAGTGE